MKNIFVIGSINTDFNISAPHIPEKGETITGGGFFTAHGGKGANQATAAARLGGKTYMCACVGDDTFGKEAADALSDAGADISNIRVVPGVPTGTAVIILAENDNRIILDKGANAELSRTDIDDALARAKEGDILLCQLENPIDIIGYALEKGKSLKMTVILNPAPANAEIAKYLKFCDIITPNETELDILGGKDEIRKSFAGTVIVTLGGDGYEINGKHFPCPKVKVVDTTSAGDTFCGGLAARLSLGDTLEDAARYGSCAASIACTRLGAQPSIPTAEEVGKSGLFI